MGNKKDKSTDFDFLLEADVQLENCVRPSDEARRRFKMTDDNHRQVTGKRVLELFWSDEFRKDLPSKVKDVQPR
jgi:hypothetical protein